MKDKKRLHLMILGGESSGKTTFLAYLWNQANQSLLSSNINDYFKPVWDSLTSEKSVSPTPAAGKLPGHIPFLLGSSEGMLEVTAVDYAGSKAEAMLKNENDENNREQNRDLAQCDAILFLIDSVKLCQNGNGEWYQNLFSNLESWLSKSFLESHDPHKPVFIACTRTDLVEKEELTGKIKELESYFKSSELIPEICSFSLFGSNRAKVTCNASPHGQLLEPGESGLKPDCDITALLTEIYRKNASTQRRNLSKVKKAALTFIIIIPIILSLFFTKSTNKPLTLEDVENRLNKIESVKQNKLEGLFPEYGFQAEDKHQVLKVFAFCYDYSYRGEKRDPRKIIKELFTRKFEKELLKSANELQYDLKDSAWYSADTYSLISSAEELYDSFGMKEELYELRSVKKEILDNGTVVTSIEEIEKVAEEYNKIGRKVAAKFIDQFNWHIRKTFVDDTAEILKKLPSCDPEKEKLYVDSYRRIRNLAEDSLNRSLNSLPIKGELKKDLELVRNFLNGVEKISAIEVSFIKFTTNSSKTLSVAYCLQETKAGKNRNYYYPLDGITSKTQRSWSGLKDEALSNGTYNFPGNQFSKISLDWNFGTSYSMQVRDFKNTDEDVVFWNSLQPDLPGMSFLIFRDMVRGDNARNLIGSCKLTVMTQTSVRGLFSIPPLLNEARNKVK